MNNMCSVLSCKLVKSFPTFSNFSLFLERMVNHYDVYLFLQDIEHQLQEDILHHFLHYNFMKSSLERKVSLVHSKFFTENFCDIFEP